MPIQSCCSSCACLRRRPWPMIESRSQTGHRRKMTSAQFAAQSVSNLCGGMESGINRIVDHWGSAPPALTSQDRSREAELLPPETENPTEENTASRLWLFRV